MRGTIAKSLRAMAVGCATSYNKTNEGTAVFKGVDDALVGGVPTYTAVLNPVCKRVMYKKLKKAYKALAVKPQTFQQLHSLKENL